MSMRIDRILCSLTVCTLGAGCAEPGPGPEPGGEFESFRMAWGAGPCPPGGDCEGSLELSADGRLRLDTPCGGLLACEGLIPGTHEAEISAKDLDAAVAVLTAPDLIALLDGPRPVCEPPTDIYESMAVVVDGREHGNETTTCDQAPLERVRDFAGALIEKYIGAGGPVLLGGGWSFGFCMGACIGELGVNQTAVRYTITGHRDEDPVFLDNRGMLTAEGLGAVYTTMAALRDVPLADRYGCPDCADGGASQVTLARAGEVSSHTYEYRNPPAELVELDALLHELMDALETCASTAYLEIDPSCVPRSE